mmetsp:Transcript_20517/g.66508  ORF Transcript_20517/g.66508 Transcript_20517/m.66508 type:complete len:297 (+) Transcript_20517:2559-3449(+)
MRSGQPVRRRLPRPPTRAPWPRPRGTGAAGRRACRGAAGACGTPPTSWASRTGAPTPSCTSRCGRPRRRRSWRRRSCRCAACRPRGSSSARSPRSGMAAASPGRRPTTTRSGRAPSRCAACRPTAARPSSTSSCYTRPSPLGLKPTAPCCAPQGSPTRGGPWPEARRRLRWSRGCHSSSSGWAGWSTAGRRPTSGFGPSWRALTTPSLATVTSRRAGFGAPSRRRLRWGRLSHPWAGRTARRTHSARPSCRCCTARGRSGRRPPRAPCRRRSWPRCRCCRPARPSSSRPTHGSGAG